MKLHLPVSLRRAVMKVLTALALPLATTVASGTTVADSIGKGNLGKTMFVGDSITHGAHADLYSWRWSMHKILVDNGISYEEVGVKTGNTKDLGTGMLYGTKVFQNVHSAQCSARAYEIAERKAAGQFEGTGIQHWLGENEPDAWPEANKNKDGFKLTEEQKPVDTFFMLIGTNDWLSDGVTEQSRVADKAAGIEKNLIGRTVEDGTAEEKQVKWSGTGDLDTIVNTMFSHNSDASLVLLTVPTWGTHTAANRYTYVKEDYKTVQEYNVHLKEWVKQNKNKASITLVDTNLGLIDVANTEMPGKGVDSFFYNSSDRLHPSTQGELIIAGNVAKQLGIAGRTAGQERKAGSDFQLKTTDFVDGGTPSNVTTDGGKLQFAASNGTYTHDWGGASPTGGYTVEFKLDGGIGDGGSADPPNTWDTTHNFSVSVGSGTTGGTLNINEAYIQWGSTVLYSLDTSSGNLGEGKWDAIRIAYIMGNPTLGLSTGFYVWLGDQLIGEALGSDSTTEGLSITNSTSGNVTLSELYMDANSWAPTTTLKMVSNPTIAPEAPPEYRDFAGEKEWASDGLQPGEIDVSKLKESLKSYSGATVSSGTLPTGGLLTEAHEGDIYVTFTGGVKSSTFESFFQESSGTVNLTGNVHLRFLNLENQGLGTFFVINDSFTGGVVGDMYLEFSSKDLTVNSGKFGSFQGISVAAGYKMGSISGTYRMVFNAATLDGDVYGGFVGRDQQVNEDKIKVGGVEIYLNGGEFKGNIYAGGWSYGSVGAGDAGDGAKLGRSIIITGDDATFAEGTDKVISLGGNRTNDTLAHDTVDGDATLTISGVSQSGGIAQFAGTLDGGVSAVDGAYTRSLVITGGTAVAEMKASVTNFDKITVQENSVIGLKLKGTGLTSIEIEAGSELGISTTDENSVSLSNGGATLVLSGGKLNATVEGSEQKGTLIVKDGGSLTLTDGSAAAAAASLDGIALAAEGPSVQQDVILQGVGSYTAGTAQMADVLVTLDGGGQYTIGSNVENAQIRLTLTGMTSDSSITAGGTHADYGITLVGSNNIELGEGMQTTAFFGTSGALDFEEGATLEIGLSAIMKTLRDGSESLTYKLANSSLEDWNSNEQVKIARELDLLGWTATFTAQGELQLTKTATSTPGDLYWDGGSLTWGGDAAAQPWKSGSTSGDAASWTDRSSAHLSGDGTITMGGDVIVNNLEFEAGTFTFSGEQSLSVLGNVTVTIPTVDFGNTSVEVLGDIEVSTNASFTFGEHLVVQGKVKWWSNKALTLSEGATFGELDPSWSRGDILLGGDLVLTKGLCTQNDGKLVTFKNSGSEAVYLVFNTGGVVKERTEKSGSNGEQEGIRICSSTNTSNYGLYVFENVGIAAKGRGTILKLLDGSETQWDVGGNLLAAEQGTLVIDGAHPMVVTGKILADGGTISTTQTTASVSAYGLEVTNGGSVSTNGTWTISGAVTLDDTSTLTIQGGKLDLTGAEAAHSLEGHLVLDGGELSTSAQGPTIKELRVASGGKLTINGDTSITSLTSSQSLTSLTIAGGKSLSLQSGTLKLGREFSWGMGAALKLTGADVVLDATDLILFGESDSGAGNLTIDLSTVFMQGIGGSNQRRLFSSRWDSSWTDKITLTVDGKTPTGDYEGLHISSDGKLVWNEETDQLFWGKGDGAHTSLTLGTGEQTWGAEKGSDTGATWSGTPSVSLEATSGTVTVNVGEGATMKNFSTADVSGDSNVTYNLTATDEKTATVNGTLSVGSNTTLSVGNNVTLSVSSYTGTGTLKLGSGSKISFGNAATVANMVLDTKATSELTLGGDLTVSTLTGGGWNNAGSLTIKNSLEKSDTPLTFTVNSSNSDLINGDNIQTTLNLGTEYARINLVKTGTGMHTFSQGKIVIYGDLTVQEGVQRITAATSGSVIHGKVSGEGELRLAGGTIITLEGKDGDAGNINKLHFYASSGNPTLYLGGDLTFKEVLTTGDSGNQNAAGYLTLNRATGTQGVNNAPEVVYLLWDSTGQSEGLSWSDYIDKFGTIKHGSNEDGFAGDTGYGKAGNSELTISGAATIDGNFKVKEGTMTFSEAATLTADKHIVVGDSAKLNFSGGIDGRSGTLTSLTLSNGAGVEFESGTLKSKALTLSGSATLTLKVASGSGANLDLGVITFSGDENTKLTIKLNGWADAIKTEGYQLFDVSEGSQWSTAKEAILGLFSRFVFQDGNGTAIGDVKLTEEGRLVLSDPTTTVDTYTWSGTDGKVTLGDSISDGKSLGWDTDSGAVDASKTVVLNGTGAEGTETVTVTVSGSGEQDPEVNVKALTVGETAGGTTVYTFSGTSSQKLTVEETLTLNTPTTFESSVSVKAKQLVVDAGENGAVNFVGGLELTNGTESPGLQITSGNVTFSGAGALTVSGTTTVGENGKIVVSTSGAKSLGAVTLSKATSELVLKNADSWDGTSVTGVGSLVLDGITALDVGSGNMKANDLFTKILGTSEGALGAIVLKNSQVSLGAKGEKDYIYSVKDIYVEKGSKLTDAVWDLMNKTDATEEHTVHLSSGSGSDSVGTLSLANVEFAWDVALEDNATLEKTAANGAYFKGKLTAATHTLTVSGTGLLQLRDTFTTGDSDTGVIDLTGGTLELNYADEGQTGQTSAEELKGYGLKLSSGSTLRVGTDESGAGHKAGGSSYTVNYLEDGSTTGGTITVGKNIDGGQELVIDYSGDPTKSVTANVTANDGKKLSITKKGTGTQTIAGTYEGDAINVQGGKLEFDLTGDGTAGAVSVATSSELAVKGHTLTISDLSGQGSVTGDGMLKLTAESGNFDGTFSANLDYDKTSGTFSLKSFTGSSLTVTDGTLTLTDALTTGSRTVTLNGGTLKLATGSVIDTLAGTGGTLDITGTVSVTNSTNSGLTGLKLSSGGKLEVGSSITSVGLGEITLAGAAELSLGGTSNLKLSGTWGGSSSDKLTLRFTSDFLQSIAGAESYQLVTGSATGWNDSHVTFADVDGYTVAWDTTDGTIKVTATAVSADTWKVDGVSDVWNTTDANWGNGVVWTSGAAKFSNSSGDNEISVEDTITADSMDVSGGGKWAFKTTETNSLTVSGATTVSGEGTTLTLDGSGHFTFTGGITVNEGAEVVVTGGKGDNFTGAVSGEGSLVVTLEGTQRQAAQFSSTIANLVGEHLDELHIKKKGDVNAAAKVTFASGDGDVLKKVSNLYVDEGAALQIGSVNGLESSEDGHTLHLNGVGQDVGALHFAAKDLVVGWKTVLDGDSVLSVSNNNSGTINSLEGKDHNLTIGVGSSSGTITLKEASGIGEFTVVGGNLVFGFTQGSTDKIAENVSGSFQIGDTQDGLTYKFGTLTGSGAVTIGTILATLELSGKTGGSTSFEGEKEVGGADASAFTGTIAEGITVSVTGGYWTWKNSTASTDATVSVGASGHVKLDGLTIDSAITSSGDLALNGVKSSNGGSVSVTGGSLSLSGTLVVGSLTNGIQVSNATSVTLSDSMSLTGKLAVTSATNMTVGKDITLGGNGSSMDLSGVGIFEAMADEDGNKVASLTISLTGRNVAEGTNKITEQWALKLKYEQLAKLAALDGFGITLENWQTQTSDHHAFLDTTGWSVSDWANDANINAFLAKVTVKGQDDTVLTSDKKLVLDQWGHLSLVDAAEDWTWDTGTETWSSTSFEGRNQSSADHDITFSATEAGDTAATITVTDTVSAKNITVDSNAKYTFTGGTSITATGTLNIGSGAEVSVNTNLTVTGATMLEGKLTLGQHQYTFTDTINGGTTGELKAIGSGGNVQTSIITLNKGGELKSMDLGWGVTLSLGADLILHDWLFNPDDNENRYLKIANVGAESPVNLVLDFADEKTVSWHYHNGTASKGSLTFDNVGLEKRGQGELTLKETEGASDNTHWDIQNLKVTAGNLKIDDSQFTVQGKLSGSASASLELLTNAGLTLTGGTDATGFSGTITMGADTSITLGSGAKLKANTLALGTSTGTIKLTVGENFAEGFLDITSLTIDGTGSLKIVLTDWDETWKTEHVEGLTLFTGDGLSSRLSSLKDKITFWGGDAGTTDLKDQVQLGEDGKLTWISTPEPEKSTYTWSGSGGEVTLGDSISNGGTLGWDTESGDVNAEKSVVLQGTGDDGAVTVTVSGDTDSKVSVKSLTVGQEDDSTTYTFEGTGQTLVVEETLTLNDDTTFKVETEVKGALKGAADLTVKGDLTLGTALNGTDFTGGITLDGGTITLGGTGNTLGTLTVGETGGTLSGAVTSGTLAIGDTAGTLTLSSGAMTLSGTTKGEVSVGGTLTGSDLTVGGLSGSGTLGGSITVDGTGGTFAGTVGDSLELTVKGGTQGFSNNVTLSNVTLSGGTLKLAAGGTVTQLTVATDDSGTIEMGGNLSIGDFAAGDWAPGAGSPSTSGTITIKQVSGVEGAKDALTLTLNTATDKAAWTSGFTLGEEDARINLKKTRGSTQIIGAGMVTIFGDVEVGEGILRFTDASSGSTIHGTLSGAGTLDLGGNTNLTITGENGSVGSIGTLQMTAASSGDPTLNLGGDLSFKTATSSQSGRLALNRATGVEGAPETVYLLWDSGTEQQSVTWDDYKHKYPNVTFGENTGYGKTGSGELVISGSATIEQNLKVAEGTMTFSGAATLSKAIEVGDDTMVNFNGGVSGSLTKLALGAGSTVHVGGTEAQTLTVGGLTWGKGAKLDLDSQLTIGLSGVTLTQPDAGNLLTIDLSSTVLDSLGSGKWQLFSDWSQVANWEQYIEFKVDGETVDSAKYGELGLDADGKLTWVAPEGVITWTDEDNNGALVWGTDSEWTVDGEGGQAYATDKDVVFQGEHDGTIEVTLADSTTVGKGMELKLADGGDAQAYNFELGAERTLTVTETLTVGDGITAEFSGAGELTVNGGTTVEGKLAVSTSGAKNLGEVTLNGETSEFVVKNADSWDAGTTVTGAGSLVFEGLSDLASTTVDALIKDDGTLGSVVLRGNTSLTLSALGDVGKASKLVVETGASLSLSNTTLLNSDQAPELHIAGTGAIADGAALLYTATGKGATSNAKLVLDGDATISNVGTVWFGGTITAGDVLGEDGASRKAVLTKKGAGDFEIYGGGIKDLEKVSVAEGSLVVTYTTGDLLKDTVVSLDGGALHLNKSAGGSAAVAFTLKGLEGTSTTGAITAHKAGGAITLTLNDTANHETSAALSADSGTIFNITKENTGVQTFSGAFTAGTVTVKGGGITLANGTGGNVDSFVLSDGTTLTLNSGTYTAGELSGAEGKYGSVTGDGTLQLTAQSGSFEGEFSANLDYVGQAEEGTTAQFSLKSFTGKELTVTSGELTLTDKLATGERTVTLNGGTLKLANGGVIASLAGTGGALNVTGMVSIGASTHTGLTSLTLAKDSKLDLTALGSMNLGAVTVTDTATIAVGRDESSITLLTVDSLTGNLTIDLTGVNKKNLDGLQLFSEGIDFAEQVSLTGVKLGSRDELWLDAESGQLRFTTIEAPITWDGTGSDELTWKENSEGKGWTIGEGGTPTEFMNGDTVLFADSGESANTVTLDATEATEAGKLKAASVTVENGTWTFTGAELVVDESLEVGGTATFKNATSAKTLTGSGSVTLSDGGSLTIQDTLTADKTSGFTGGITLDNGTLNLGDEGNTLGKKLTLGAGGGTINGSITAELDGQNAGTLTLGTGAQNLSGSTKGVVEVGGTLTGNSLTVGGLSGKGTLGGTVTVDGKGGTFEGTVAGSLSLTVQSGTQSFSQNAKLSDVALNGGTLKLAAGGAISSLNGAGGALEVGGIVEVGSVAGSLTKLALGDGATMHVGGDGAQTLTVGGLTWGKDATLELDSQFTIALAEGALAQPGEGGQLTIDLSSDVLDSLGSGNWQLFSGWSGADWTQYFTFTIDGQAVDADRYGEFGLDEDGRLTWSEPSHSDLYWDASKDDDKTLTWGGEGTEWSTSEDGTPNATWPSEEGATDGTSVHIAGEEEADYAVEMAGDVTAKDVEFNGGNYTFAGEGSKLTTEGDLTVGTDKKTTVNFGNKQLDVGGNLTLGSGSSVTADGKLDVTGDVNVGSGSLTANGGGTWGSAQVAPGGSLTMKKGTTVNGGVKMGNGSSVTMEDSTVNGELSVEGGKLTVEGKSTLGSVSGTLTGLEIAKDGSLTVQSGNGLAADSFTWGSGSTLHLGSGFTGTLDFGSMDGDGNLTLDFSSQFLEQLGSGGTLFGGEVSDFDDGWNERFNLTVDGKTPGDSYGDLKIGDDGALTWMPKAKDKDKYDSSKDNDTANDGTQTEWNTKDPTDPSKDKNIYDSVGDYGQVVVDSDTNINFGNADKDAADGDWSEDGLTVHNLNGTNSNAKLTITGDGNDNGKVTLKNSYSSKETQGEAEYRDDLTYSGGITVEKAELHINHEDTNPASLHHGAEWGTVMGGELNLSQGQGLFMDRGVLKLQNEANQLTDVTFINGRDGQLVVDGGSATVSGDIVLRSGEAVYETERNHVHLENGGTLELVGGTGKEEAETTVGAGVTIGGNDASGSAVGMKGKVNMEKGSRISGLHLILENEDTVLTVGKEKQPAGQEPAAYALAAEEPEGDLGASEGDADAKKNTTFSIYGIQSNGGHLTGNENMVINVRDWDHVFTGSMAGYKGTMTFVSQIERIEDLFRAQTPQQYFTQVTDGSSDWNMVVDSGARVTLDVLNSKGRNAGWVMGDVELRSDSQTTLGFTFSSGGMSSASATGMSFGSFRLAEGAGITLQAYGSAMPTSREFVLGQMTEGGAVNLHWDWDGSEEAAMANEVESNDNEELELKRNQLVGGAWLHVESAKIVYDDTKKQIVLEMDMALGNSLAEAVQGIHQNATEGANALWQLTDTVNNPKANEALNDTNSDTSKLSAEAQRLMSNGNKSELAKLLAAAAGAGYTGYSAALGEDMHRQLTAIRNRTTSMGDEAAAARDEDMPYWHAWLNAESSYRELDADDLAPGYRVNGWGGTFGVDADISRNTTLGLALTAMYNDLKCTGADSISGDMDTMYATAFLRHMRGRWMHTLVLSGGTADFKTHRTVMSGSGNYTADADTSGYSLGALYEIGYTTVLSKDSRRVMQYVFNVEARHNSIDGFTESGSDAGLVVDDMDSMTVTFGLGARLQSLFGGKVYNRSALFEARFLVKADAGDRRGEAATRFINGSYTTNMVGAEVGAVGVELGAGLTVPVGSTPYSGSFFIDGSLEFRQGWTSFDATLGYRISF